LSAADFPKLKRFEVTVQGYGAGIYVTTTRGKAMADAWRCDAFGHLTFGEFLKRARCVRTPEPPGFGEPCTFVGKPALCFGHNQQYVSIQLPGRDHLSSAHPYDILPMEHRPRAYRDRDAA
jgi:hypothetical protein